MTRLLGLVMLVIITIPCTAAAHPHIFIENSVRVMFDDTGMTGVQVYWLFDEMFSSTMIGEYDRNKDGKFSAEEVEALRKGAFTNLKNYHYFTYITIGTQAFDVKYVKDFQAAIKNNKMTYTFLVPCHIKAATTQKKVTIAVYDETYYSDIVLVSYRCEHKTAPGAVSTTIEEIENFDKSFYFGQIAPVEMIVTLKK